MLERVIEPRSLCPERPESVRPIHAGLFLPADSANYLNGAKRNPVDPIRVQCALAIQFRNGRVHRVVLFTAESGSKVGMPSLVQTRFDITSYPSASFGLEMVGQPKPREAPIYPHSVPDYLRNQRDCQRSW